MPQITRQEWRWATGWSITLLILSCILYLIATLAAPEGWQFAGILVNPLDGHSYLAKIRQGLEGNWLFHLTYTPEPHDGAFIFTFYLALGHLAAFLRLPPILVFHLARLVAGLFFLLVAFKFIAWVTPHSQERRLAFGLLLTASGFGWLGAIFGAFPIDLWVPEAFVPYSLYANPHFPLSMALMLIIFQGILESSTRFANLPPSTFHFQPSTFWAALAALVLALTLPFALLTVWAVLAVYLSWLYLVRRRLPWPQIWLTLLVGVCSAPVILYDYWVSKANPSFAGWSAQNLTAAPSLVDLLLGYGLIGPLAIVGGWMIAHWDQNRSQSRPEPESGEWLIWWWAVVGILLIYLPFDLQRRLITGLHIPLCLLAAIGLSRWLANSRLRLSQRRQLTVGVITVGALGTLFVWTIPLLAMRQSPATSETTALLFVREEEVAAFTWLSQNAAADDVVLASPRVSMFVPGQAGARVFYGHPFETIEAKKKRAMVEAFYRGETETVPAPVDFIIYGPAEQVLGQPVILSTLPVVFSQNDLVIYKVDSQ
jgi:hypothetical protein